MTRMRYCLTVALLTVGMVRASAQSFAPVNPAATTESRNLLKYLYSINSKKVISGVHNFNQQPDYFSDSALVITGKMPALWGTDFIMNGKEDPGPRIVQEAIKKSREGYLITLMYHQGRPTDTAPFGWKQSIQGKLTDAQWHELVTPGTALNKKWIADIDRIAGYLKQLQEAHVTVLWRPLHEMNGVWFWWGNHKGLEGVAKLWQMMYDRYTNYHHLNNLIWIWGANGLRDIPKDEAYNYADYYPGAQYVDVLGADVYHFDYDQSDYEALVRLAKGKLIALTEVGELPKPEVLAAQPKWAWFMVWTSWLWTDNPAGRAKEIFNLPQTLNHDDVKQKLDALK